METNSLPNKSKSRAWFELFRLPNLFTIPGDIILGAVLSGAVLHSLSGLILTILISVLLYLSGLLLNDYFDREIDKLERPGRPIPSGRVSAKEVLYAALAFLIVALGIGVISGNLLLLECTIILAVLVVTYNGFSRKVPVLGFINMGLCRGMNVLLGASAFTNSFPSHLITAGLTIMFYISGVTVLAYKETDGSKPGKTRFLLLLPIIAIFATANSSGITIIAVSVTLFYIIAQLVKAGSDIPMNVIIGSLIRGLVLLQITLILAFAIQPYRPKDLLMALILGVLLILSGYTSKKYYGS